jgi:hypothetical protein
MKTPKLLILIAIVAVNGCTTEDYYRSANRSAVLRTSANLDAIDTIKTSAVSHQRTFLLPIEASDENGNMNLLTTFADGGETRIVGGLGDGGAIEDIELSKERYNFVRGIEFTSTTDGRHTISVRVRDDFGNISSMEKFVYSFTNMRPKLKIVHYAKRHDFEMVEHFVDFSKSFDRDSTWGGDIDSLFTLCTVENMEDATIIEAMKVIDYNADDPGFVHVGKYVIRNALYDGEDGYFTDIYAWVKDNEGLASDTVHISMGHVGESVARQEYEGR